MKLRLPLLGRILAWFFLNLALVAGGLYFLVRSQFVLDRDFLLTAGAADRLQAVGDAIAADLQAHPAAEWPEAVEKYESKYAMKFYVFDHSGHPVVGDPQSVPPEVRDKLMHRPPPPPNHPPHSMDQDFPFHPHEGGPPPPMRRGPEAGPGMPPTSHRLIRAGSPVRYWALVRSSLQLPEHEAAETAVILLSSTSWSGGGLFFDWKPWLMAILGVVIFSALFWLPFVRGITKSISRMTAATQQMAQGRFDVKLGVNRGDELGTLATSIEAMAVRLDGLVTGQKRFLGDIAHELCAPLARLRVALGILEERVGEPQRADVARANEKADEMANLINELLSFSKAALGGREVKRQPVNLLSVVETAAGREGAESVKLEVAVPEGLRVMVEPELLTRALANLLRNAIRYAGEAGPIRVAVEHADGWAVLSVSDQGPGIPQADRAKIFDPFYRLDVSRDRQTGGVGLGLAIVKTCVEACQGTVRTENNVPRGLRVILTLPTAN